MHPLLGHRAGVGARPQDYAAESPFARLQGAQSACRLIEASGVPRPARIYDLRSTFASDALAAGVSVFTLARLMGTSVGMIEAHHGALIDSAAADALGRLEALDA
jgi:hypothetical protein